MAMVTDRKQSEGYMKPTLTAGKKIGCKETSGPKLEIWSVLSRFNRGESI